MNQHHENPTNPTCSAQPADSLPPVDPISQRRFPDVLRDLIDMYRNSALKEEDQRAIAAIVSSAQEVTAAPPSPTVAVMPVSPDRQASPLALLRSLSQSFEQALAEVNTIEKTATEVFSCLRISVERNEYGWLTQVPQICGGDPLATMFSESAYHQRRGNIPRVQELVVHWTAADWGNDIANSTVTAHSLCELGPGTRQPYSQQIRPLCPSHHRIVAKLYPDPNGSRSGPFTACIENTLLDGKAWQRFSRLLSIAAHREDASLTLKKHSNTLISLSSSLGPYAVLAVCQEALTIAHDRKGAYVERPDVDLSAVASESLSPASRYRSFERLAALDIELTSRFKLSEPVCRWLMSTTDLLQKIATTPYSTRWSAQSLERLLTVDQPPGGDLLQSYQFIGQFHAEVHRLGDRLLRGNLTTANLQRQATDILALLEREYRPFT